MCENMYIGAFKVMPGRQEIINFDVGELDLAHSKI